MSFWENLVTSLISAFILIATSAFADTEIPTCSPNCLSNQVCIRKEANRPSVCEAPPSVGPLKNLILPFDSDEEIYCTHSSGSGSHSWTNAFYALDLANAYDKPAAVIRA